MCRWWISKNQTKLVCFLLTSDIVLNVPSRAFIEFKWKSLFPTRSNLSSPVYFISCAVWVWVPPKSHFSRNHISRGSFCQQQSTSWLKENRLCISNLNIQKVVWGFERTTFFAKSGETALFRLGLRITWAKVAEFP